MDGFLDKIDLDRLNRRMDELANQFAETHDPVGKAKLVQTSRDLAGLKRTAALAALENAFARCRTQDMRTPGVMQALDYLKESSAKKRPFEQFRKALDIENVKGRWQTMNASLNAIKLQVRRWTLSLGLSDYSSLS